MRSFRITIAALGLAVLSSTVRQQCIERIVGLFPPSHTCTANGLRMGAASHAAMPQRLPKVLVHPLATPLTLRGDLLKQLHGRLKMNILFKEPTPETIQVQLRLSPPVVTALERNRFTSGCTFLRHPLLGDGKNTPV